MRDFLELITVQVLYTISCYYWYAKLNGFPYLIQNHYKWKAVIFAAVYLISSNCIKILFFHLNSISYFVIVCLLNGFILSYLYRIGKIVSCCALICSHVINLAISFVAAFMVSFILFYLKIDFSANQIAIIQMIFSTVLAYLIYRIKIKLKRFDMMIFQVDVHIVFGFGVFVLLIFGLIRNLYDSTVRAFYWNLLPFVMIGIYTAHHLLVMLWNCKKKERGAIEYIKELQHKIHRDKEIIPILINSLINLRNKGADAEFSRELVEIEKLYGQQISSDISETMIGRSFNSTGFILLDRQLKLYLAECQDQGIDLHINVRNKMQDLEKSIKQNQIQMLIGDLYRNAVNSVESVDCKKILLTVGKIAGYYFVEICDNGVLFDMGVLGSLGIMEVKDLNGKSGFGLIDIFNILASTKASIIIEEFYDYIYSKSITIVFDKEQLITVKTFRKQAVKKYIKNPLIQLESED